MKVAAVQMVSGTDVQDNLIRAGVLLKQAAADGAELAVLPEYFCLLGRRDTDKLSIAEEPGVGPIQDFLAGQARSLGLWIVGGTLPVRLDRGAGVVERVLNRSCVFDPQGELAASYDKIHLFRFDRGAERYDESRTLQAGERPTIFELTDRVGQRWRIGLSVCYDLRFPELYRHYASLGADLLVVPSAFTHTTGQHHWNVLLRARAIENLSYVVAAAQGGIHANGRQTWGHSMVVDPWGEVLGLCPQGEAVVVADVTPDALARCRTQLPALQHRVL